jgi:hypothetical protein
MSFDQSYPDGIAGVMRESQTFYKQQLGKTFTLNDPVVEVVDGQHDTNYYINNNCEPGGDRYACVIFNMQGELQQRFGLTNPDATSTDGTCMSASFYGYPNCTFNATQKSGILNGPYGSFLS